MKTEEEKKSSDWYKESIKDLKKQEFKVLTLMMIFLSSKKGFFHGLVANFRFIFLARCPLKVDVKREKY